jgi:regulator of sirC expression with transglutaminase-like and TPR domain
MEPTSASQSPGKTPSPERQQALLTLLADDDPKVHQSIRRQLLADGETSRQWLRAHLIHPDPAIRARVKELVHAMAADDADSQFLEFCLRHGEHFALEEAVWLFVRTRYADANIEAYRAQLDEWANDARPKVLRATSGAATLRAINEVLFTRLGFHGNSDQYYEPANSYLNKVIDLRRGIPISLCAVYQFVTQRLELPVTGIGMPGHFLCRYQSPVDEYYIDPFHQGMLLTRAEARQRLEHFAAASDETLLQPISARRTLQRMIANLHLIHKERRDRVEAERLQRYLVVLSR